MSIIKEISSGSDAKEGLINGVNKCADVVGSTMGFRGRLVVWEDDGGLPQVTKDGRNILDSIQLEHPVEQIASELLKQASRKTADHAADGTTNTIVLAQAFVKHSHEAVAKGKSPIDVKHEIEASRDKVIDFLNSIAEPVTDKIIYDVAKTSANSDESIAKIVSDAFIKAGEDGQVTFLRSTTDETVLDHIDGTLYENGYADELFVNVPSDRTSLFENNPLVLVSEINFKTNLQIIPFLEYAVKNEREIVIISEMEFPVQQMILQNVVSKKLKAVVVKPASFGQKKKDLLMDMALLCSTQTVSTLSGDNFTGRAEEFLGEAKRVLISKTDTIVVPHENSDKEKIQGKIAELKDIALKSSNQYEKSYIKDRISKLSGGVSIIRVGGITESEINERLDRVEDSVGAVKSAKEENVVAGGGLALHEASRHIILDDVTTKVLTAPISKILGNAGKSLDSLNDSLYPIGYDVKEFKTVNMFEAGIVDPVKVIRHALTNAISVANTILMIDNTLTNKRANG